MKSDNVLVKASNIEGRGVFATRNFQKGEIVLHWDTSHILSKQQADNASSKDKEHISFTNGKFILIQAPERYINHSCEPNTNVGDFADVAIKDIKKDQEITSDYTSDAVFNISMPCKCGTPSCKKIIQI